MYTKDGAGVDRCFSVITPRKAVKPLPLVFWFHGSGNPKNHSAYKIFKAFLFQAAMQRIVAKDPLRMESPGPA